MRDDEFCRHPTSSLFQCFYKVCYQTPFDTFLFICRKIWNILNYSDWSLSCSKYSSVLGKLSLQIKFLSTVASADSFIFFNHLYSFLATSCKLLYFLLKKKKKLFYGFFHRGFTQVMQFSLWLQQSVKISPPAHPALVPRSWRRQRNLWS